MANPPSGSPITVNFDPNFYMVGETQVHTGGGAGDLAVLTDDKFVLTYTRRISNAADGFRLGFQIFDANGNQSVQEIFLDENIGGFYAESKVTALGDGGFFLTYQVEEVPNGTKYLRGRRFDSNGNQVGQIVEIDQMNYSQNQVLPSVTMLSNGDIMIQWMTNSSEIHKFDMVVQKYSFDLDVTSVATASSALNDLDNSVSKINMLRSSYGATMNRLEYAIDNLTNITQNTEAARSRILDTDYALETTELARTQIIQEAATAMLTQANQQAQQILALLKAMDY